MARKPNLTKLEKQRQTELTEDFFREIGKLENHPEDADFIISPEKREAFLTGGKRLQHIVETARRSGAIGGKVVSPAKKAHLKKISENKRPGRVSSENKDGRS